LFCEIIGVKILFIHLLLKIQVVRYLKSILWYGERILKYYVTRPRYKKIYRSFDSYCKYRREYEKRL